MRKIYFILAALFLIVSVSLPQQANAQAPQTMTYKLVVRDSKNSSLNNLQIGIKSSYCKAATTGRGVYVEL
jgi:hypothetical protein